MPSPAPPLSQNKPITPTSPYKALMFSVSDVAKYFLSLSEEEVGDLLSNLKLQKLVYYAQGFHLALFSRPLFMNPIEAWTHGPVIPDLYRAYKEYGAGAIPIPSGFDPDIFDRDTSELLDEVYRVYGQYSAWMLRDMTHQEGPWVRAFNEGGFGTEIECKAMQDYFRTQLKN